MRLHPLNTLLVLLCSLPATRTQAEAGPTGSEKMASREKAEKAQHALDAGDTKLAISLLSPAPLKGPGTCVLAKALLAEKQPERAMLYLERCRKSETNRSIGRDISSLKQLLRQKKRAPVSLAFSPAQAHGRVDSVYEPTDVLLHDEEMWLPAGSYRIELQAANFESAAFAVEVDSPERMLLPLTLRKRRAARSTVVDLGENAGSELGQVSTAVDPRPKKFKPILPKRYQRAPDPTVVPLDDSDQSRGPWPWIAVVSGTAAVGAGVAMHVGDNTRGALVGYGLGGSLLACAAYLFLRSDTPEPAAPDRISLSISPASSLSSKTSPAKLSLGIQGRW